MKQMKEENAKANKQGVPAEGAISYVTLDLSDLDTVKTCVEEIRAKTTTVDYLILNAGIMATPYGKTKQNLELQIGTSGAQRVA